MNRDPFPYLPPITTDIMELFRKWGIDPDLHLELISDLMRFVYDEKLNALEAAHDAHRRNGRRQTEASNSLATATDDEGLDPETAKTRA